MPDKQVESAYHIDLSGFRWPIIAIYENLKDYPGCYVARVFDADRPTNVVIVKKNLDELQNDIAKHTAMVWLTRRPSDDSVILGTWI